MDKIPQGDIILQQFRVKTPSELLDFLIENQIRKSRNATKAILARKLITVNGKLVTQFDHMLKSGDKVAVMKVDQTKKIKRLKGMSIVYEDKDIIVIDKEAGLLSVATDKERTKTAYGVITEHVKKKQKEAKIFVLHRLDREVSGLMVFGKDLDVQGKFQRNWNFLVPVYNYVAVIEGEMTKSEGTIRSWLTENKNFQVFAATFDNGGQEAITHYKTIKTNERYSLVSYRQETRRKNQIRVQMQQVGHPIVGDRKYGAALAPIKRIALHVQEMTIKHPTSGRMMDFKSTTPKAMTDLLKKININNDKHE